MLATISLARRPDSRYCCDTDIALFYHKICNTVRRVMLIHPWDASADPTEWRRFVAEQGFGQLIAAGAGRRRPVIVPTQFVLDGETVRSEPASGAVSTVRSEPASGAMGTVLLHLARPNPIWKALAENPYAVLSIAGDWAYVPTSWKVVGDEDPTLGVPTTYYAAAQLSGEVEVIDDPEGKLAILRRQLATLQPGAGHVDPAEHHRLLPGIRGIRLTIDDVQAKFKYGGNVDAEHRLAVADRLNSRQLPGDEAARAHLLRRLESEETACPHR